MPIITPRLLARAAGAFVLGVAVGAVGTALHRASAPWGLVLCLALVASATVLARAWSGAVAVVGLAVGVLASVQVLAGRGPGGDVLVPASDALGWVWAIGAVAVVVVVAVLPRSWFADVPLRRRASAQP